MKKNTLATVIVILIVATVSFFVIKGNMGGSAIEPTSAEVAEYIGQHSVLYVQTGCVHCIEQEALFGSNVKYLNIVDCVTETGMQQCSIAGIEGTPTWVINGQKYEGVQTIEKLKELTGYK
jgi:glutaredoxin